MLIIADDSIRILRIISSLWSLLVQQNPLMGVSPLQSPTDPKLMDMIATAEDNTHNRQQLIEDVILDIERVAVAKILAIKDIFSKSGRLLCVSQ